MPRLQSWLMKSWLLKARQAASPRNRNRRLLSMQGLENRITPAFSNGATLVTYRLAIASTAEFTALNGGVTKTAETIDTAVEQLNLIFGRELSINFVLVPNNNSLIFTDTKTDDYTSGDRGKMLDENQAKITSVITSAKFDIGHVFDGTDIGGQANNGVGLDLHKAKGVSGTAIAGVDANFLHTIAHEIGHQFGAGHTFNAQSENKVLQDEYHASSAYEPGTGSTLMSYAKFDDGVNNYATAYSNFFHTKNLDQITNWMNNTIPTVGTKVSSGNIVPFVNANPDYTIPANTPFVLTGTGTDPGDTLIYTWEQYDLGPRVVLGTADNGSSPLFRTFEPTVDGRIRSFPAIETVLAGKTGSDTEVAATTSRQLNFRLTGRDQKGAFFSDATVITTVDTGSKFEITNFNNFASVYAGTTQTLTWNVAGTTGNGINVSHVVIDLSTDGGKSFTNIASSVPNDGSAEVTIPVGAVTNMARFRIRGTTNIFYDINNVNFSIRAIPTIIEVFSTSGSGGTGTLRQAILDSNDAPGVQTITFDPTVFDTPQTITFASGERSISAPVVINGPGSGFLTISGNNTNRIFNTDAAPSGASISISSVTFSNGLATEGGAIYVGDESLTIEDCVISNSSASEDGGAINVQNAGSLTLIRSTISGNTATDDGGGIYFFSGGSCYLIDSTLAGNRAATGNGGGLYFFGTVGSGGFSILTSTIANNSASVGGGGIVLPSFYGTLNVVNSTVTGNYTFDIGGGGIARTSGTGTISLFNSIVSGNTGPSFAPDILSSGTVNSQYSAIGSTSGFTLSGSNNIIGQNLKLRPLANNGGPTPTVAYEFDSPLRNVGGPSPFFPNDQRGFPRGDTVDIGAFELLTTVVNANHTGPGSLRDAVAESNRVVGTDTISFGSLFNTVQTITLLTGEIALTDAVTIQGNGESLTRISGNNLSRIFNATAIPAGKTVTLRGLTLTAGSAAANGGAILMGDESLVVEDSVISSSYASADGGAIHVGAGSKLTLTRSTLVGNSAFANGGALRFVNGGNSEIIASSLISNNAGNGGAIYLDGQGSTLTVLNSTLSGNSASFGGGITTVDLIGALTVRNSTITANTATNTGGGLRTFNGTPNIHVESTVVAGNTAVFGPDIFSSATVTANRSAIGSADGFTLTGANNLPFGANLKLGALANNGGSTLTHLPANDSPLVNFGSNPAGLVTDQRGVVRTLFGTTDIGSVESAISPPDITAPTITMITSDTPNGTYGPGSTIDIRVTFSEPVTLTGTLNVTFDNGGVGTITAQQPNFVTLTGSYTVAAGQATPDLNVTGLTLTGGSTLRDASLNNAVLTPPSSNLAVNKNIAITTPDTSAPAITSITSPTPNGTYGPGASIGVALNFSEVVTLSGYLFVFFDTGGSLLIQGPQTGQTLNGTYTVGFNQNSTDLNVTAVQLDVGSFITDSASNHAVLTLPGSNLANNSNIVVSTPTTPTFIVTNTNDSGTGSLRQAVIDANGTSGFQNIVFNSSFNSVKTITLTSGELNILDGVSITGPGANLLTIHGNNAGRVFNIASGSAVTLSGVGITGGQASAGGGILIGANRPPLSLVDVRVFNNFATNQGGGIWVGDSTNFTITRSTISGNTSGTAGGGLYAQFSSSTITDSAIVSNASNFGSGGGLFSYGGLSVRNSTISGNSSAGTGGGIATGGITIQNSTITNNKAGSGGGGVARSFGNGVITFDSSIVSGNTGSSPDISSGGTVNVNFSAVGSNTGFTPTGSNNLPLGTNLLLGALANNGGPTMTHALLAGSPAINKGSNPAGLSADQRGPGYGRVSGGAADIGAYEFYFSPLIVLNANDSGAGSLRDAIAFANSNPGPDTVTFDATFFATPRTITLGGTQLTLTDTTGTTTITGPGVNLLTVSGNNLSRAFLINSGVSGAITGMTIANGNSTYGGALQNSGAVTVSNSRFTNNKSDYGGAIFSVGVLSISNSSFDNNAANFGTGWGGAIINGTTAGAANITACTFTNNYASSLGGAVIGFSFNITDSTFANNTSGLNGGAIRTDGTVVITGSTFSGNVAANDGGAIMSHGTTTIVNSTLANNTAKNGGGVQFFEGTGTMRNVTVAYNTAGSLGGGTLVGTSSSVAAINTIVAGNVAPVEPDVWGVFNASSLNNVFNLSAAAAGLGTLANNGGSTQTIALLPGSPAINAGTSVSTPATDQRGLPRVGNTDIGAFEAQTLQPARVSQITVNGGAAQRSRVTNVVVTFDHPVTFATTPAAAFQLQRQSDGKLPNLNATVNSTRDVVTLTFLSGDAVDFGSLADGRYTLTVKSAGFASDGFDGDSNGTGGDDFIEVGAPGSGHNLFRLFGDADGNGTVNTADFLAFRLAFLSPNPAFDFDGSGSVDTSDFLAFRLRFLQSV